MRSCTLTAARAPVTKKDLWPCQLSQSRSPREGTSPTTTFVTSEQKAALIKGASQLLLNVLNKPLDSTFVVIEEAELDNWGWGGLPVARREIGVIASAP